ncbi:MAG: hypothetical protein ACREJ3_10350 [Polyangiaceae bacterium]
MRHIARGWTLALAVAFFGAQGASCSSSNDSGSSFGAGGLGGVGGFGSNLVTTCGQICNNVLADCGVASSLWSECNSACGDLALVPAGCVTQFAGYLACLSGATSIHCDGRTVEISPSSCAAQENEYELCNGGPSPIAACIALPPGNTACGMGAGGPPGPPSALKPVFCVGQPDGCSAAGQNPFGIGTYCCGL